MKKEDLLQAGRDRFKEAVDADRKNVERGASDLVFAVGEGQWPEQERLLRQQEGKPTLTFNRMPQFVRKVTGQIRDLNPAIRVSAADSAANDEVAEIYEGIVREIEQRCDAASIYESAAESAAQCGIGHFRIRADYCDEDSFNQHILIERVYNPFSVVYDPRAKDPTRKDAEYCFVIDEIGKEEFKRQFPDARLDDFTSDHSKNWLSYWSKADNVVVAEYIYLEYDEEEIGLTPAGQVIRGPFPKEMQIARKRRVRRPKVMWARMSGAEILEGPTRLVGRHIPVIAVTGEEIHVGEEIIRSGVIRHAKDAQVGYNVMKSTDVETVLLQPRAPYMVTAKQVAGLESYWEAANQSTRPYLPYNPDETAPPPMRVPPPVASSGLMASAQGMVDDMKATIGIYDASLGARSNETSGVAIQSRQREAEISTSVYSDNMVKAVKHAGDIIVGMIPEVYDSNRVIRILGADDQEKMATINAIGFGPDGMPAVQNDMAAGKYSVRISVGPSFASKKAEASAGMLDFMAKIPQSAPVISDLVAGAQEWPDADRIAERLKKMIPPNILEDDEKDQDDPQKQAEKQMAQQQAQAQAQLQARVAMADAEKQIAEAEEAKAKAKEAEANAEKAVLELREMQLRLQRGVIAPVPVPPGQPGPMPL